MRKVADHENEIRRILHIIYKMLLDFKKNSNKAASKIRTKLQFSMKKLIELYEIFYNPS